MPLCLTVSTLNPIVGIVVTVVPSFSLGKDDLDCCKIWSAPVEEGCLACSVEPPYQNPARNCGKKPISPPIHSQQGALPGPVKPPNNQGKVNLFKSWTPPIYLLIMNLVFDLASLTLTKHVVVSSTWGEKARCVGIQLLCLSFLSCFRRSLHVDSATMLTK